MTGPEETPPSATDPLRLLLHESHLLTADRLPSAVVLAGRLLGAAETVLYLADYAQSLLLPMPGEGVASRQELVIDRTAAGLAFRRAEVVRGPAPGSGGSGQQRLWVPLLDGVERLGVLELTLASDASADEALEAEARALASLLAELVLTMGAYGDTFAQLRRRKTLTLAAEIQWDLLPPLTFGAPRVVLAGALEPAYEIGGDTFDYAVDGDTAQLMVLDAIGHGLPEIAAEIDAVIAGEFGPERFATAVLSRLDLATGKLRWVNAGHPEPLILRNGGMVSPTGQPPDLPLGLQETKRTCGEATLQPGDRVLLYTDGIVEARSPEGEFFGEQRLADFVIRSAASGLPAPETLRRLMREILEHQADQLQDDASIVILEWRTGAEYALVM